MPEADARMPCVACREPIQPDARLCPYCRTAQTPEHWKTLGTTLKWLGGLTALISLMAGMIQLNSLFQNWQERQESVRELVRAAEMQSESGDYQGAWKLLDQALGLEPGSRLARQRQVVLAMRWLRDVRIIGDQRFTDIVDVLLPVLYRGVASATGTAVADMFAHIGWADYLRYREGMNWLMVDRHFQRALEIDPQNVYAHVMQGFWILWPRKQREAEHTLQHARQHFAAAIQSGRETAYVREIQLLALLNAPDDDVEVKVELIRVADEMRQHREAMPLDLRRRTLRLYNDALGNEAMMQGLLTALLPVDHLATFTWLSEDPDNRLLDPHTHAFFVARLTEAVGDLPQALALYRTLQDTVPENVRVKREHHLDRAIERVRLRQQGEAPQQVAMIVKVTKGSPGETAGLREGDIVVTYDSVRIHRRMQLLDQVRQSAQKAHVIAVVIRDHAPRQFALPGGSVGISVENAVVPKRRLGVYAEK